MADVVFVVVQHDWDNMENHSPQYQKPVASCDSRAVAERWIEAAKKDALLGATVYQGWNRQTYPQWTIVEVPRVREQEGGE